MELALETPLFLYTDTKPERKLYTRHILRIGVLNHAPIHDSLLENVYFSYVSEREAIAMLERNTVVDAILIQPKEASTDLKDLGQVAKIKSIPFILFTASYDAAVKDQALRVGADDYLFGTISDAFFKKLDFIKRLKAYKNKAGKETAKLHSPEAIFPYKQWALKRAFDILVSFILLTLLSPLLLLIALIVKLESKGPVFYISKRAGAGYRIFNFYKFRSMRVGADAELQALKHLNQYGDSKDGVFFKLKNDPRITRFGSFLRNTSLDEIPQLYNVLIGDMSLVGNRPLPLYEAAQLTKDQIAWRFLAPSGITGLWQITKRGKENMSPEERIALDTQYAMKSSLWFDLKIMFLTLPALLQKEKV